MRVLVTGAEGFAGRHVVDHLRATTNWHVVSSTQDLRKPIRSSPMDAVVHLASRADVTRCNADPVDAVHNNVDATLNLLEWAREQSLTHFIQVSTNEVYGPTNERPAPTEWAPLAPSTPYSASKVSQEALSCAWWRTYGVPVVITNTMHLFGEQQPSQRFIPMAVRNLLAGEPVPVYSQDGQASTRCWLHVEDHADALRWLLTQPVATPDTAERPDRWHVAGPEKDLCTLVEDIAELLGVPPLIKMVDIDDARPGHEYRYALDSSKIRKAGWTPPLGFDAALARTVDWIVKQ